MTTYYLDLRDDGGSDHRIEVESDSREAAIEKAREIVQSEADDWCRGGEWGDDGACVRVRWDLLDDDDEIDSGSVIVEIEPKHNRLIAEVVRWDRPDNFCGDEPYDHDWCSDGEGGCDENPGVWSTGGTSMVFKSHCRRCGLHRTEMHTGSQRNPGEHDTVEYEMLDDETIERLRANGYMDDMSSPNDTL